MYEIYIMYAMYMYITILYYSIAHHTGISLIKIPLTIAFSPQSKTRSSLQEKELKDSLQRVQEEAQKQLEVVNSQLQSHSGELKEKERELVEVRVKLEGEVASLQQQLLARGEELEAANKNITEVRRYTNIRVYFKGV